uniref:AlNc14C47G3774 protein n=1 Tax=Albugo laibachii Nc14 TaxID=890382 RepID=F0WAR0_9STRA|nr:AlNc14C47G3774 [Albugo laibachii Nc14]|eukprot:CCA18232.1 AlNc14C47G3774 [Albugo laibachii Nc14]
MSMDGGNRPVAANPFLMFLCFPVTCSTKALLAVLTALSFDSVVAELQDAIFVISLVFYTLERVEHGDVKRLYEVRCVGWKANQQNLTPLTVLDGVEADVRRAPITYEQDGAGNRGRHTGGKVVDPLEENVAVDEALCCGSDGRALHCALVQDLPRHVHARNDKMRWHREAACCHSGNKRQMEAGFGDVRVHV